MSTENASATITPTTDASQCSEANCDTADLLARVDPDAESADARILCPRHRVEYLREVSNT